MPDQRSDTPPELPVQQLASAMASAMMLAREAGANDEVPVGALVIDPSGAIIGRGRNIREQQNDPLGHAEILAIREASLALKSWRLVDCTLVVTLEPCPMCLAACQQARVGHVIFAASDPKGGALSLGYDLHSSSKLNHRFRVAPLGIDALTQESARLLSDFFKARRK